jgi:hypothetical protein
MEDTGVCYFLALAVSVGFIIYGFMLLLQKEKPTENDVQVIQRQIKGFAFIMLAQVILVLGTSLCFSLGGSLNVIKKSFK